MCVCVQVYKGTLTEEDGSKKEVAIKLIHPHVRDLIAVDMDIMRAISYVIELVPSLEYLSMRDIVEEFARVSSSLLGTTSLRLTCCCID